MEYPSHTLAEAVEALATLPGVGRKTAQRLALHLLKQPIPDVERLADALVRLARNSRRCTTCHNLTDDDPCGICRSPRRDPNLLCVVAESQDVLAIEKTGQYNGQYHVLGGIINPMGGVSPADLHIESLYTRVSNNLNVEVILALAASMEGDTTAFYLARKLQPLGVRVTSIARGIAVGSELEYTDELTLARSMQQRVVYELPDR